MMDPHMRCPHLLLIGIFLLLTVLSCRDSPEEPDMASPTVVSFSPANGATGVEVDQNLVLHFSENIFKGTGNIQIRRSVDQILFETIDVTSPVVTITGPVVTIDPVGTFSALTKFYVEIAATCFHDGSNYPYGGITGGTTWNFTTAEDTTTWAPDTTAPTVVSYSPADDSTGVPVSQNLVLRFSENVFKGTGYIWMKMSKDQTQFDRVDVRSSVVTISGREVTIGRFRLFLYQTGYYVEIAATCFHDGSSNYYSGITGGTTWNFTTEDTTSPPPADQGTRISMDPPFILSDTKVQLSGWLDLLGVAGTISLDYGHSSEYGQTAPSQVVDPSKFPNGVTPFIFTIDGLTPGTTYHYRFTVRSLQGVKTSPDAVFTLPASVRPFDFPLHIGDSWKYDYLAKAYWHREGVHTWRILSTDGNGNWTCMDTRMDSLSPYVPNYVDSTLFMIRTFPDYIQIDFPEWQGNFLESKRVPKLFDAALDTLAFSAVSHAGGLPGPESAIYVRGIGLVSYAGRQPHMMGTDAYLDLIEYIPADGSQRSR